MADRKDNGSKKDATTVDFYFREREVLSREEALRKALRRDELLFLTYRKKHKEAQGPPAARVSPRFKVLVLEEIEKRRAVLLWLADK